MESGLANIAKYWYAASGAQAVDIPRFGGTKSYHIDLSLLAVWYGAVGIFVSLKRLLDGLQDLCVHARRSAYKAIICRESEPYGGPTENGRLTRCHLSTLCEVYRLAVKVGHFATGFLEDQDAACMVPPDIELAGLSLTRLEKTYMLLRQLEYLKIRITI